MKSLALPSVQEYTLLKDIRPMMRKLDIQVIVLQQESETVMTRDGKHINWYLVADKSGAMVLKAWGPFGGMIKSGDILHISGIEYKMASERHLLEVSRLGKIQRLGQDTFPFAERPNFSQPFEFSQGRQPPQPLSLPLSLSPSSSSFIRPPPPPPVTNYITTTPSQVDKCDSSTMTAMNFGPGWMSGLGRHRLGTITSLDHHQEEGRRTHHDSNKQRLIIYKSGAAQDGLQ